MHINRDDKPKKTILDRTEQRKGSIIRDCDSSIERKKGTVRGLSSGMNNRKIFSTLRAFFGTGEQCSKPLLLDDS